MKSFSWAAVLYLLRLNFEKLQTDMHIGICIYTYTNIFKGRCTRCARIQTESKVIYKKAKYNTGLEPAREWELWRGHEEGVSFEAMYIICDEQGGKASV